MSWTSWVTIGAMANVFTSVLLAAVVIVWLLGDVSISSAFKRNCLLIAAACFGIFGALFVAL